MTTGEAVSLALRSALFEEGLDVSQPDVLSSIARSFGVGPSNVVGMVVKGQLVAAPLTQPLQFSFTSFNGMVQIGGFTGQQAKALASQL